MENIMIDRKILIEKMQQLGIDWIESSGFLDSGQIDLILDIIERDSNLSHHVGHCGCTYYTESEKIGLACVRCARTIIPKVEI